MLKMDTDSAERVLERHVERHRRHIDTWLWRARRDARWLGADAADVRDLEQIAERLRERAGRLLEDAA